MFCIFIILAKTRLFHVGGRLSFSFSKFSLSSAFWSLDTDLQFRYELHDRSYEINTVIQAIISASLRYSIIQTDDVTKSDLISLLQHN